MRCGDVTNLPGAPQWSVQFAATDSALGCAQREVWRVVDGWGLNLIADVVELLALELVSVAMGAAVARARYRELLQAHTFGLRFQLEAYGLVIATWDHDPRPPQVQQPGTGHSDGSELYWVPMLAEAWDFFPSGSGKVVWAEVAIPPAGVGWLPRRKRRPYGERRLTTVTDLSLLERVRSGLYRLDTDNYPSCRAGWARPSP